MKLVVGDFNGCDIDKAVPHYQQYGKCTTRSERTTDLFYCSVKDAYHVVKKPALGNYDHMLYCVPVYKQKLKTSSSIEISVRKWSTVAYNKDSNVNLEQSVDVLLSYVNFCVDYDCTKRNCEIISK